MKKTSLKLKMTLAALTLVTLAACGGGGGGTTAIAPTTPTTVTPTTPVTPQVPTITADTTPPVITLASPTTLVSITAGLEFTTSELIVNPKVAVIQTGTNTAFTGSVVIKVGADNKTFTWTPSTPLPYGTSFTVSASVLDLANNVGKLEVKFTTAIDTNVALLDAAKAMIIAQGVQKSIPATEVPASATLVTDKGFLDCVVTGCALLIDTGDKMSNINVIANRTRDLVYAAYRQNGNYYVKALFKDDLTGATTPELTRALSGFTFDRVQGATNGMLIREPNAIPPCSLLRYDTVNIGFGGQTSNACPVWN